MPFPRVKTLLEAKGWAPQRSPRGSGVQAGAPRARQSPALPAAGELAPPPRCRGSSGGAGWRLVPLCSGVEVQAGERHVREGCGESPRLGSARTLVLPRSEPRFGRLGGEPRRRGRRDARCGAPRHLDTYFAAGRGGCPAAGALRRQPSPSAASEGAGLCWVAGYDLLSPLQSRTTKSLVFHTEPGLLGDSLLPVLFCPCPWWFSFFRHSFVVSGAGAALCRAQTPLCRERPCHVLL